MTYKKRKITCGILSAAAVIIIAICTAIYINRLSSTDKVNSGTLYVNGKEITSENVKMHRIKHSSYAELPFTVVLESLGFKVEWKDDNNADIIWGDNTYVLDLNEHILYNAEITDVDYASEDNLIRGLMSGTSIYLPLERELILDDLVIKYALEDIGKYVNIKYDFENLKVFLTEEMSAKKSSDIYNYSENGAVWNYLDTLNIKYESGDNYEIFTDEDMTSFYYRVSDNNSSVIDMGYHDWRGAFGFEERDGILVLNYGFGGSEYQQRYYDVETGRVSAFFHKPVQTSNELVAYFTYIDHEIVLIIQNMFDPMTYYKEIRRDFSDFVIKKLCSAQFTENDSKLEICYWVKPDDIEVTEIIDLT